MKDSSKSPLADLVDLTRNLLIERPLYAKVDMSPEQASAIDSLLNGNPPIEFDLYCAPCKQVTPWAIKPRPIGMSGSGSGLRYAAAELPNVRAVMAVCLRKQHFHIYVLLREEKYLQKIGQLPSMADLALGELRALSNTHAEDRQELGRAFGLFAHDAPLGAFVYLRRVFERMIERAYVADDTFDKPTTEQWRDMRMSDRVKALGDAIPHEVAENAGVFALLSKGIHELTDDEAGSLFPLLKAVIIQMLGDEERHRQAKSARSATHRALQGAISKFSGSPASSESGDMDKKS